MFWLPSKLPSGFDGVEPYTPHAGPITFPKAIGVRALARELGRSPSHVCRVMRGERQSKRLMLLLKKRGVKCAKEGK